MNPRGSTPGEQLELKGLTLMGIVQIWKSSKNFKIFQKSLNLTKISQNGDTYDISQDLKIGGIEKWEWETGYITVLSKWALSMHIWVVKCVMLQIRAIQRIVVVNILVDIMLCDRYLVDIWLILVNLLWSISFTILQCDYCYPDDDLVTLLLAAFTRKLKKIWGWRWDEMRWDEMMMRMRMTYNF